MPCGVSWECMRGREEIPTTRLEKRSGQVFGLAEQLTGSPCFSVRRVLTVFCAHAAESLTFQNLRYLLDSCLPILDKGLRLLDKGLLAVLTTNRSALSECALVCPCFQGLGIW